MKSICKLQVFIEQQCYVFMSLAQGSCAVATWLPRGTRGVVEDVFFERKKN